MDISINNIGHNSSSTGLPLLERSNNKKILKSDIDHIDLTEDLKDFVQKAIMYDKQQLEMAQKAREILNSEDCNNPENIEFAAENLLKLGI